MIFTLEATVRLYEQRITGFNPLIQVNDFYLDPIDIGVTVTKLVLIP